VVKNVAVTENAPKVDAGEIQIVEEHRLRELLTKLRGKPFYPIAVISLFAGLRRGEALALKWRHVDLDGRILQVREALEETRSQGVRFKAPKTKAGIRDISLPDIVVEALREHRRNQLELRMRLGLGKLSDDDLLFSTLEGGPINPRIFSIYWGRAAASIGMPDITFHALRHTHASQLIAAGVDLVTISKRLGHAKSTTTLTTYAHLFRNNDSKASEAINQALADLKW
jgi:integrase